MPLSRDPRAGGARTVTGLVVVALLVAACATSNAPSIAPSPSGQPSAIPSRSIEPSQPPTATPSVAASQMGGATSQTDTDWGRIWDALPPSFPRYPGATPSEPTAPASATLAIPSDVQTATSWMKSALDAGGWATTISGPLEDGSMSLDSIGAASGCQVSTTIGKLGGVTVMTVLYGASCPFG